MRGEKVVQAALDRVSRNRTTIMIAHRLSTVKKADHIVVLNKGKVVQWGNHESLMAQHGGPYWLLTNAQQLGMGHGHGHGRGASGEDRDEGASVSAMADEMSDTAVTEADKRTMELMTLDPETATGSVARPRGPKAYKPKGAFRSLGGMLVEQKPLWPWYLILLVGALIAGGKSTNHRTVFSQDAHAFALYSKHTGTGLPICDSDILFRVLGRHPGADYQLLVFDVCRSRWRSGNWLLRLRFCFYTDCICKCMLTPFFQWSSDTCETLTILRSVTADHHRLPPRVLLQHPQQASLLL